MDCPWLSPVSVYRKDLFITPESCCFYFAYLICSFVDCFLNLKNLNRTLTRFWSWWTNYWALWSHRSVPHSPTRKDWRTWPSPLPSGKARARGPDHRSLCHAAAYSASLVLADSFTEVILMHLLLEHPVILVVLWALLQNPLSSPVKSLSSQTVTNLTPEETWLDAFLQQQHTHTQTSGKWDLST